MAARKELGSLRRHEVPTWWRDAKLGIFVHWTPASVPAFAPVDEDIERHGAVGRPAAMGWSPYTEWYENSLRFPDSPVARFHRETYADREYRSFVDDWQAGLATWDPDDWARTFAETGARYVVLVTKHHDGYCLWPSTIANPRRPGFHSARDVVGELGEAVRGPECASGSTTPVVWTGRSSHRPLGAMSDLVAAIPRGDYPAYAAAQFRELIERYRPSVLWNDIAWPDEAKQLWPLFAEYYAAVPDGVVNDRWMPWNPLAGAMKLGAARRALDAGRGPPGAQGRWADPPRAAALRRADPGVHVVPPHPASAVGVRARDGPVVRLQRRVASRALPHPGGPALVLRRHGEQERESAPQRRASGSGRADPRRAAAPAQLARQLDAGLRSRDASRRARGCDPRA